MCYLQDVNDEKELHLDLNMTSILVREPVNVLQQAACLPKSVPKAIAFLDEQVLMLKTTRGRTMHAWTTDSCRF